MNLQEFTGDPGALIEKALADPKLNPRRNPTIETAMAVLGKVTKASAVSAMAREVYIDLMDAVAAFEVNNGEYEDIPAGDEHRGTRDDYEAGLDDAVEAAITKWEAWLSADWLGKNTIDTELWLSTDADRTRVQKLAESAAKEVYKTLTADITPAQALASAGVLQADVALRMAQPEPPKQNEEPDMSAPSDLTELVAKAATYLGKQFDQLAVYEDVSLILEGDDDLLVHSAGQRIGLSDDDVTLLQVASWDIEGDDPSAELVKLLDEYKPPSGRAQTKKAKEEKAQSEAEERQGATDPSVLVALKECGVGDTAMAEALGVSRSTYTNYTKGKTPFSPDGDQYEVVRSELVERANKLLQALAALDGTDLVEVA